MENQFFKFVLNKTNLPETDLLKSSSKMFLDGKTVAEVAFDEANYKEKKQNFWFFDKIEAAVYSYKAFQAKQQKYVTDIETRTTFDNKEEVVSLLKNTNSISELEEAFRPYKRKKKTKATLAREAGLQNFADKILSMSIEGENFENGLEPEAKKYINPSLGYITYETVLKGVQDILVEKILTKSELRQNLFKYAIENAKISIKPGDKYSEGGKYTNFIKAQTQGCKFYLNPKNYDKFPQIKKAWEDGFLKVTLDADWSDSLKSFQKPFMTEKLTGDIKDFIMSCGKKALEVHALPSVSGEVFDSFYAISREVYLSKIKNDYTNLLTTPAFGYKAVLSFVGRESGESTLTLVSHSGEYISSAKVDLNADGVVDTFNGLLKDICQNLEVGCVAIALNDTTRKAEKLILKSLETISKKEIPVVMADATGLPRFINQESAKFGFSEKIDNDALQAFYMAKRVQDPIFEYGQHEPETLIEVPQFIDKEVVSRELKKCLSYHVAQFGISTLNANPALLNNLGWFESYDRVKDIAQKLKEANDLNDKKSLMSVLNTNEVERFSKFFRFSEGLNLLDRSRISLEDQSKVKDVFKEEGVSLMSGPLKEVKLSEKSVKLLGDAFYKYLREELQKPFFDFRKDYKVFSFSKTAESIEDVKEDNLYWGIVTKFSSFGAFVDMGVGVDGLIHLSELSNEYVSDPRKILRLGQWVLFKALKVDIAKKQLSFSKIKADLKDSRKSGDKKFSSKSKNSKPFNKKNDFKRDNKKGSSNKGNRDFKKPRKPQQPFNNPFAALSELKK